MKLLSYRISGELRHGMLDAAGDIAELGEGDLLALLWRGLPPTVPLPDPRARHRIADVQVCAPLSRPGKLLAAAANYQDYVTETGGEPLDKSRLTPRLFLKPSSCVIGPTDPITLPSLSDQVDWEAELGVVIGSRVRDIGVDAALGAVAGYLAANDVSARSLDFGMERDTEDKAVWFFDWLAGKWFDGFAPFGPYLVTADEVADPQNLPVRLELNGEVQQHGSTKDMIFSVAELIAHASRLMTLEPGDVILTGTPSGVGAASGRYLRAGDRMTMRIGELGELDNEVH